jgi:hypothetical protein
VITALSASVTLIWPETMWPLVYQQSADALVVPRLNLGTAALRDPDGG